MRPFGLKFSQMTLHTETSKLMYNLSFLFVVLHKPTLLPSTFNHRRMRRGGGGGGRGALCLPPPPPPPPFLKTKNSGKSNGKYGKRNRKCWQKRWKIREKVMGNSGKSNNFCPKYTLSKHFFTIIFFILNCINTIQ